MKQHFIYKIVDTNNDPIYIGKTCNLKRRKQEHLSWIKKNKKYYLYRKLRKMIQEENYILDLIVIQECSSLDEANKQESFWISYFTEAGFSLCNLTSGGDGTVGHKPIFTEEWRKNLSISARNRQLTNPSFKGKKHTDKTKRLMSQNHKDISGTENPFFGKQHTQELKDKLSKERFAVGLKSYIITSPEGKEFFVEEGLNEFCRKHSSLSLVLRPSGFSNVLAGRYKTHKGWMIRYVTESLQDI